MPRVAAWVLSIAAATAPAAAEFTFLSGVQSSTAQVTAFPGPEEKSYNLHAADPLASWSPPDQDITVEPGGQARVQSRYQSVLTPTKIAFHTAVPDEYAISAGPTGSTNAYLDHDQRFQLTFRLDAPAVLRLSAGMDLTSVYGWGATRPIRMEFSGGGKTFISWLYPTAPAPPYPWLPVYPPTELTLDAGVYSVLMQHSNHWEAGKASRYKGSSDFTLEIIPAPGSVLVLACAGVLAPRTRRSRAAAI